MLSSPTPHFESYTNYIRRLIWHPVLHQTNIFTRLIIHEKFNVYKILNCLIIRLWNMEIFEINKRKPERLKWIPEMNDDNFADVIVNHENTGQRVAIEYIQSNGIQIKQLYRPTLREWRIDCQSKYWNVIPQDTKTDKNLVVAKAGENLPDLS